MEYVLPPSLVANQADWTLIDFTGIQQSPLSGAIRTVSRGQRWQAHLQFHDLITDDRACLAALIAVIRGKSNRMWIADPTYKQRGSFPAPELLINGSFMQGLTGWNVAGSGTANAFNRQLSLATNDTAATSVYQAVNLVNGVAYALRSLIIDGPTTGPLSMGVQMADPGHTFPQMGLSRGLITAVGICLAGGAANQQVLNVAAGGGLAAGMIALMTYTSLRRCAMVMNPSGLTYYCTIPIDTLPSSTAGLLRAGDRVEINGELKTVTFDLNSNSSGVGQLMFEPALRKLCPDNTPVIIGEPMMKGIMSQDAMQPSRPGGFSDFDFTLVEA